MAYGLVLEFTGVDQKLYDAVNEKLGIDSSTGEGDWPKGIITHAAGTVGSDGFVVYEVWESKAAQEAFMASRLGPALGAVGVPDPTRVTEVDLLAHRVI